MNESNASGLLDQAKGKVKQAFGEATDNQSLANEGAADQVKGNVKEAWGNTKDTAHDLSHSRTAEKTHEDSTHTSNSLRDDVTNAAEHAKQSMNRGLDNLKHKAND